MNDHELRAAGLVAIARMGITLDTLAKLLQCDHGLAAWCSTCNRYRDLDLERLVRDGHGGRQLVGFKPRCRACGGPGKLQVRAPSYLRPTKPSHP